jgi:3-methylfumaryl-CoA hydratase
MSRPAGLAGTFRQLATEAGRWRDGEEWGTTAPSGYALSVLADMLGGPMPGDVVPPWWHLAAFPVWPPAGELGSDGHPAQGLAFPPVSPRRRLFAGARLAIEHQLRADQPVRWLRRVTNVAYKAGRSGDLLFVTLETSYFQASEEASFVDAHDLVYRGADSRLGGQASTGDGRATEYDAIHLTPDEVMLFRFSALTGNSHRIHYDERYAVEREHLPGRLVHAPLMAALMLEPVRRAGKAPQVCEFRFRAVRPVVLGAQLAARIVDRGSQRWTLAVESNGSTAMEGVVTLRDEAGS